MADINLYRKVLDCATNWSGGVINHHHPEYVYISVDRNYEGGIVGFLLDLPADLRNHPAFPALVSMVLFFVEFPTDRAGD